MENLESAQILLGYYIRVSMYYRLGILNWSRAGDLTPLAKYIRGGGRVTSPMRPFLADILEGKVKCPPVKVGRWATMIRNGELVSFIEEALERGEREKDYSKAAEKKFGRTWRNLQKVLEKEKPGGHAYLSAQFEKTNAILRKVILTQRGLEWGDDVSLSGGIKYRLSDMSLSPHTLP
jgi:hypothetical protein